MYWPPRKPSVNDTAYKWIVVDDGSTPQGFNHIVLAQQFHKSQGEYVEHYRVYVEGSPLRKTFFGETALDDVYRYVYDEYRAIFGAL